MTEQLKAKEIEDKLKQDEEEIIAILLGENKF